MASINKEKVAPEGEVKTHSIRITLTSQNVKALEKGKYPSPKGGKAHKRRKNGKRIPHDYEY